MKTRQEKGQMMRSDKDLLSMEMYEREEDWGSVSKEVKVFCSTYNSAVLDPTKARFKKEAGRDWLFNAEVNVRDKDIVVINLQEVVDLNNPYNLSYVGDITTNQCVYAWEVALLDILNGDDEAIQYKVVASVSLVGLAQFVFVTEQLFKEVYDVRTTSYGCGFLGISGNKGAIGTSITIYDAPLVFMNCHLAAGVGKEMREKREQDLRAILGGASFDANTLPTDAGGGHSSMTTSDSIWNSVTTEMSKKGSVPTQESIPAIGRVSPLNLPELPMSNRSPSNVSSFRKQRGTAAPPEAVSPIADPLRNQAVDSGIGISPSAPVLPPDSAQSTSDTESPADPTDDHDATTIAALERVGDTVGALPVIERVWRSGVRAAATASRGVMSGHHEVVILAGDLNSRLDLNAAPSGPASSHASGDMGHYEVLSLIDGGQLEALAPLDEVCSMLGIGNYRSLRPREGSREGESASSPSLFSDSTSSSPPPSFGAVVQTAALSEHGFQEGPFFSFPPTYKYQNVRRSPSNVLTQVTNLVASTWSMGLEALGVPPAAVTSDSTAIMSGSSGGSVEDMEAEGQGEEQDDYQRPSDWEEYLSGKEALSTSSSGEAPVVVAAAAAESASQKGQIVVSGTEVATSPEDQAARQRGTTKGVRVPAWCDRILHCTPRARLARTLPLPPTTPKGLSGSPVGNGDIPFQSSASIREAFGDAESPILPARVELHQYSRSELRGSDHRPVVCTYSFHVKAVDERKENDILAHFEKECILAEVNERKVLQKSLNTSAVLSPQAAASSS